MRVAIIILGSILVAGCHWQVPTSREGMTDTGRLFVTDTAFAKTDSIKNLVDSLPVDKTQNKDTAFISPAKIINTKGIKPDALVSFAKSLVGTPYVYGSVNPAVGFDCSGFITYVFNHFGIAVPRSSVDFTNVGKTVPTEAARPGDLILFTGTNPAERHVGHMGLVMTNPPDSLQFIHSSSGRVMGVTITPLNDYYKSRFVKVIRLFP